MFTTYTVQTTVQKLLRDQSFVDYCRQEIHTILRHGHITKDDFASILNIIMYILENNPNHNVPKEIFADVLEAFVLELLQRYGINMSEDDYAHIRQWIQNHLSKPKWNWVERLFHL